MEPKDFKDLLETVYTTTNENGELSKLLTKIYDAFDSKHIEKLAGDKSVEDITAANATLVEVNEKLRGVNMDLFLKVGTVKNDEGSNNHQEDKPTPLTEVYG